MRHMTIVVILLAAVVLVSGCSGLPPLFGSDVIKIQTRSIEDGTKDVIVVKDIKTIPTSSVLPDQEVELSFVIENRDSRLMPVSNVQIDLFNAPGFKNTAGEKCNDGVDKCVPETDSGERKCTKSEPCTILPGEEKLIRYRLRAPSTAEIANIRTQARLDFKVLYDFSGSMNFVIPVVNKDEVLRRQREGETLNIMFDKSFSSGPLRIDVEPLSVNYILHDYTTILLFHIKNVGSGTLYKSQIEQYEASNILTPDCSYCDNQADPNNCKALCLSGSGISYQPTDTPRTGLVVQFPPQLSVVMQTGDVLNEIFRQTGNVFFNYVPIPMYRDQTQTSLRFPVKLTPETQQEFILYQIPYRSYEIKSTVYYTYELRKYADVTIQPFEGV